MQKDIRWQQRFSNFKKAFEKFKQSVEFIQSIELTVQSHRDQTERIQDELIKEGLIQRFEYTHELAWKVMKDYALFQGIQDVGGSRDAIREAFQLNLIDNGEIWMDMLSSRNKTSHTYNETTVNDIYQKIIRDYYPLFLSFNNKMQEKLMDQ